MFDFALGLSHDLFPNSSVAFIRVGDWSKITKLGMHFRGDLYLNF